ncbi:hypothetical protein PAHAL_3G501900 [Panicum hallii]|uniref:Uncharacterized protein n=1 Tax=Panicum hallii TaxID=206008 RepID=A0A2T8KM62_9POAL|nr:hypothetical protein PAHAL_3G501900 [Panicum hallii]
MEKMIYIIIPFIYFFSFSFLFPFHFFSIRSPISRCSARRLGFPGPATSPVRRRGGGACRALHLAPGRRAGSGSPPRPPLAAGEASVVADPRPTLIPGRWLTPTDFISANR